MACEYELQCRCAGGYRDDSETYTGWFVDRTYCGTYRGFLEAEGN